VGSIKILVIEDSATIRDYLTGLVQIMGFHAHALEEKAQFVEELHHHNPDLLLLGSSNNFGQIRAFAEVVQRQNAGPPILFIQGGSGPADDQSFPRVANITSLPKDFDSNTLKQAIERLVEEYQNPDYEELDRIIVGRSPSMVEIKKNIVRLSKTDVTVLLTGESGTGKELVARAIHKLSPRADKPFIKVNSAALPSGLIESELFGFEKGAFTGAFHKKPGKFELAHSGTILLDEVGDIPVAMQGKLLQVLQDSEFFALGSTANTVIDARVLAATNANLGDMVSQGRFRPDLYYRLNVVSIHIPPLRERRDDIGHLYNYFLKECAARYGKDCTAVKERIPDHLYQYSWPGNVRELENFIRSITVLGDGDGLYEKMDNLGPSGAFPNGPASLSAVPLGNPRSVGRPSLKKVCKKAARKAETEAIVDVLSYTHWNRRQAADLLKVSYKALLNKIKEYGIQEQYEKLLRKDYKYHDYDTSLSE
jgi:two-component system response regulator AtoC